jgi:hypothetical protein
MALGGVGEELVVVEEIEDGGEVALVLGGGLGKNQDVVKVDDDKVIQVGGEDVVHEPLEGSGGIAQAERHDGEFEVPIASTEGGLVNVRVVDADLVVPMA